MEIVLALIIILLIFIIIRFNIFVNLKNKVKQSKSSIDVYLTQRFDLIPNLVECVKAYAEHEEDIFTKIAELRSEYNSKKELKTGEKLNKEFNNLLLVGENNPNLKSNEQFLSLQKTLIKMESQLQAARRLYNGDVTLYNTTISKFPDNIIASIFNFKQEELFEIEEYKANNIKIDL